MEWSSVTGAVTNVLIDTWWNVNVYSPDELVYTGEF